MGLHDVKRIVAGDLTSVPAKCVWLRKMKPDRLSLGGFLTAWGGFCQHARVGAESAALELTAVETGDAFMIPDRFRRGRVNFGR